MHTLEDVIQAVERLSPEDRAELRTYLNQYPQDTPALRAGTMDIDALLQAAEAIRASMPPAVFDKVVRKNYYPTRKTDRLSSRFS